MLVHNTPISRQHDLKNDLNNINKISRKLSKYEVIKTNVFQYLFNKYYFRDIKHYIMN